MKYHILSKHRSFQIFGAGFLLLTLITACSSNNDSSTLSFQEEFKREDPNTELAASPETTASTSTQENSQTGNLLQSAPEISESTPQPSPNQSDLYPGTRVIDGDTLEVSINGQTEKVRLIGVDTPESVHPSKSVECFSIEASNKAKSTLEDQRVRLESDPSQSDRDKYQRLLRYVFLEDSTNFNRMMIEHGFPCHTIGRFAKPGKQV